MRTLTATLVVVPALSLALASDQFETPQQLTHGGDAFDNLLYPTPVLHDLDGDRQRELVVGDLRGHLYACRADSTTVSWSKAVHFTSEGETLRLNNWCCIGMSPQFVDFDADGHTDIVTATFEGTAFIVRGSATGWHQPEHLVDSQDRPIALSLYYDMEKKKYDHVERSPEGRTNAKDHCVSAIVFDWDDDGDYDLLLGAKEGRLYLQRNEGEAGRPSFTGVNELLEAGGEPFNVPGGLTAPRPVDWDGDGVIDLVCGSFEGGVYLYRNGGTVGAPKFEKAETLIAAGTIDPDGPRFPNNGCYADPVDYDRDGDLDLLVGGYAQWQPETPDLTDADRTRIEELNAEIATVQTSMEAMYESIQDELEAAETPEQTQAVYEKMTGRDEYKAIEATWNTLYKELGTLQPPLKREAGIWLYTRK